MYHDTVQQNNQTIEHYKALHMKQINNEQETDIIMFLRRLIKYMYICSFKNKLRVEYTRIINKYEVLVALA